MEVLEPFKITCRIIWVNYVATLDRHQTKSCRKKRNSWQASSSFLTFLTMLFVEHTVYTLTLNTDFTFSWTPKESKQFLPVSSVKLSVIFFLKKHSALFSSALGATGFPHSLALASLFAFFAIAWVWLLGQTLGEVHKPKQNNHHQRIIPTQLQWLEKAGLWLFVC